MIEIGPNLKTILDGCILTVFILLLFIWCSRNYDRR